MAANYPREIASTDVVTSSTGDARGDGPGARVVEWMRQTFCGLHGHDILLRFEKDRMFLKCVSCGHESPGWEITGTPPGARVREAGAPQRSLAKPQLIRARRIA